MNNYVSFITLDKRYSITMPVSTICVMSKSDYGQMIECPNRVYDVDSETYDYIMDAFMKYHTTFFTFPD